MSRPTRADDVVKRFHRLHDYVRSEAMADAVAGYMKMCLREYADDPQRWLSVFGAVRGNRDFQDDVLKGMAKARLYQASEKTVDLTTGSWRNIKTDVTALTAYHLPSAHGWAWLDKPFIRRGSRHEISADAISWDVTTLTPPWAKMAGTFEAMIEQLKDPSAPPRAPRDQPAVRITHWKWTGSVAPDWTARQRDEWARIAGPHQLLFVHSNVVPLGAKLIKPAEAVTGAEDPVRWVKTLWGVMETPLTTGERARPEGHTQQRHKERFGESSPEVHVISLRAPKPAPAGGPPRQQGTRNYENQWVSLGYHRHREAYIKAGGEPHEPLPPARGDYEKEKDTTCLLCGGDLGWVTGSIKGPDGAPIKNIDKLYRF